MRQRSVTPLPLGDYAVAGLPQPNTKLTPAAVLVPLVLRGHELTVLLTQRTKHLSHHPGQVSFPGGRCEPDDADAVATALRETEEEIGLHHKHIEVIGQLDHYQTGTDFLVTPVVSFVTPPFELRPDPNEVDEIF